MSYASRQPVSATMGRSAISMGSAVVGALFLLIGVLGFIPGITTNYDEMGFAGPDSQAMLLGVFQVSILHNIVHLLFGIAGLAMARTSASARTFLIGGGVFYLALWLFGLIVSDDSGANFIPLNLADDWLHLVLGAGMIALGFLLHSNRTENRMP